MNSKNFSLAEAAVAAIVVLMLGILLVPVISRMRQASENTACQGNLRQLGTLTLSYSSTNGGLLPALRTSYGVRWSDTLVDFNSACRDRCLVLLRASRGKPPKLNMPHSCDARPALLRFKATSAVRMRLTPMLSALNTTLASWA